MINNYKILLIIQVKFNYSLSNKINKKIMMIPHNSKKDSKV